MAFPDDILLPHNQCEICGAELTDEVVIQEFADGSIARLCSECAAGAALQPDTHEFVFPDDAPEMNDGDPGGEDSSVDITSVNDFLALDADTAVGEAAPTPAPVIAPPAAFTPPASSTDIDPMEKTRELLSPVVDLITLQSEMQGALQRLATSLQTFATGVITENIDKKATVEGRLEALERELELTRARLRETEALLAAGSATAAEATPTAGPEQTSAPDEAPAEAPAQAEPAPAEVPAAAAADEAPVEVPAAVAAAPAEAPAAEAQEPAAETPEPSEAQAAAAPGAAGAASFWDFDATVEAGPESALEATAESTLGDTGEFAPPETADEPAGTAAGPAATDTATQPYSLDDIESTMPPVAPKLVPPPVAPPAGPPTAEPHKRPGFELPEVQIAQRYFNESQFTSRVRDVRRSLGRPKANLTKLVGGEPRALVTVFWDIIWYQYLVDLRRDTPVDQRVSLHREGMDLEELTPAFREKNASLDDEGRLDASELEVKLLSDPSTLITAMSVDEERALEDATEEIWDQKTAPEFKWDD